MNRSPFGSFFKAAAGLQTSPYDYQTDLAERAHPPDILAVPTGCGKTAAAVLSWAWRRRECPDDDIRRRTPRRLVYCLPMRSLVEQVHEEIVQWFANLGWLQRAQPRDRRSGSSVYRSRRGIRTATTPPRRPFDTDPDLSGGHLDVSRFVRGDATDLDVAVLWRSLDDAGPENDPPPYPDELCRVLCHQVRNAPVVTPDETGWRVDGEPAWLWTAVTPETTVYAICPGRGFNDAATLLGTDYAGVLVRDGWQVYRCYQGALHQSCLNHYADIRIMPMSARTPPLKAVSGSRLSA